MIEIPVPVFVGLVLVEVTIGVLIGVWWVWHGIRSGGGIEVTVAVPHPSEDGAVVEMSGLMVDVAERTLRGVLLADEVVGEAE